MNTRDGPFQTRDVGYCIPNLMGDTPKTARDVIKDFGNTQLLYANYTVHTVDGNNSSSDWSMRGYAYVNAMYPNGGRAIGQLQYHVKRIVEPRDRVRVFDAGIKSKSKGGRTTVSARRPKTFFLPDSYAGQNKAVVFHDDYTEKSTLVWCVDEDDIFYTSQFWDPNSRKVYTRHKNIETLIGGFSPKIERPADILLRRYMGINNFESADRRKLTKDSGRFKLDGYNLVGGLQSQDGFIVYYLTDAEEPTDVLAWHPSQERKPPKFNNKKLIVKIAGEGLPKKATHVLSAEGALVARSNGSVLELNNNVQVPVPTM